MTHRTPGSTASCIVGILLVSGCATAPVATGEGSAMSIEGTIAAIDTQPWAYDGHAVIQVDTADRGRVAVQLPARWNLCKAAPVAVDALAVGMRVRATGTPGAEGELVVCQDAAHRLVPAEGSR
jgi:hypothetical protein